MSTVPRSSPKLRSSCDACGHAKTKCDRSRPHCGRCISLNLSCVYGPSRQFGKRPRRRAGALRHVALPLESTSAVNESGTSNMNNLGAGVEEILPEVPTHLGGSHIDPTQLDPTFLESLSTSWLGLSGVDGSNDTTLSGSVEVNTCNDPSLPPTDFEWDRIYQEPNEILQRLTVHRDVFSPETVLIEMSRVLEANKTALQRVSRFLKLDHARRMPHLTMLYANIIVRVLMWYQDVAGFGDHFKSRNRDPSTVEPTTGDDTPTVHTHGPMASWTAKCFAIQSQSFTVGEFDVDEPCIQLVFKNQLICHEVYKAGAVIDELVALATDERVAVTDQAMYSALGIWLKGEHEKTLKVFKDAIRRSNKAMGI